MLLIDAHLDLAMNALNWDRNLDLDVYEIRQAEADMIAKGRGRGTVSLPELRKAEVGVCLATVIDRTARPGNPMPGSACQEISYAKAQGQLAYYRVLEAQGKVRLIDNVDRWSHGGSENIYLDGDGRHPAYLRGIGGEVLCEVW